MAMSTASSGDFEVLSIKDSSWNWKGKWKFFRVTKKGQLANSI